MNDIKNFLDKEGKLKQFPSKQKMQICAFFYLAGKIEKDRVYSESEFNDLLLSWSTFGDPATLRRELYDFKFVNRNSCGSEYMLAQPQPKEEDFI